jgi:hypothetical protein
MVTALLFLGLLTFSACGSTQQSTGSSSSPSPDQVSASPGQSTPAPGPSITSAQLAATLNTKGVNCSSFTPRTSSYQATSQGYCGFPDLIEISVFPSRDTLNFFVHSLAQNYCANSSSSFSYVDGGSYVIYAIQPATTLQVATALNISATKLC